ncbi:dTDP-4-dehydrorhamnose reductase [Arcticibacter tournemirensis]|uniref:dTDP-4-dehydrorhamnose reductase n=1 Tax=Arcticibacter tournemirensis TaxID=699437 RepID=A0A5M9H639_9SPHI|nr:family 1 glycosylhydrolase [Arcticibacter tournemirensis]KAA8481709.1 sugar nucleotide-binding protein [Arcticibacter tournemirensis]TQM48882.1 dTDP-4-dehydrorhamnose reductase [Arcticibacter tournemirensis]
MELWGGIECTINRVGNLYLDQLDYSGHYNRTEDLELFADLGISKIRYPVLWERHLPEADIDINWSDTEKRLLKIKELGIDPIAGLVHHGSGPAYVQMTDDSFPKGLAGFATKTAAKFPWIKYYTPINEPLTTARFCGLYGHWYPHESSDNSFLRILINECKATVLAMREIRKINPGAILVQTEDLGKIHSTPLLKYQADFENTRRWLSIDLLCGKVHSKHPLWSYLQRAGINDRDLGFFLENPCPPDIIGFNHYVTSERFLDERVEHYPSHTHGGNHFHRYADVEAVRVAGTEMSGPYNLLKEAWERYHLPMAITEVHLHCTREEQLRWFDSVWKSAIKLEDEKIDLRAVTTWAMLGSFGWNKLLTRPNGEYEPGIYDVRSGRPRPTALCKMIRSLSKKEKYNHPVTERPGWWKKDTRIIYNHDPIKIENITNQRNIPPLLIVGKTGTLGNAFARICKLRDIDYKLSGRQEFDITDLAGMEKLIREVKPWAIINTAGFVRVDEAEDDELNCFLSNTTGPGHLAALCNKYGIKLMTFSSDLVFDGRKNIPYIEDDNVNPLNNYGLSKAKAEQAVLQSCPDALIIRTSAFFGPWDKYNFVSEVHNAVKKRIPFRAVNDIIISPTYVPDLVNVCLDLLIDDEKGIWHLANDVALSWFDLAAQISERSGGDPALIIPISAAEMDFRAMRPIYSALRSTRGDLLPCLDDALNRYFAEQLIVA